MSKNILDFLSSYEDELNSQAAFYEKNISRIEGQIKDTKKQITAIKKNIDKEYKRCAKASYNGYFKNADCGYFLKKHNWEDNDWNKKQLCNKVV